MRPVYLANVPTRVAGISCIAAVTSYAYAPHGRGFAHQYSSPEDWLGYEEIEFEITDRKGYSAPWLERKLTPADHTRIEQTISQWYEDNSDR